MLLQTEVVARPEIPRLALHGELDIATVDQVRLAVRTWLASDEAGPELHLDCSDVEFIDAAGVGALISAKKSAAAANTVVRVCEPSRQCRYLLDVVGLESLVAA